MNNHDYQKRNIQESYRERLREISKESGNIIITAVEEFVKKNKIKVLIVLGILALFFILIFGTTAGLIMMLSGNATSELASYQSLPLDLDAVEADFTAREINLQNTIGSIETDHPDFDEYRYNIGDIGHDPFVLLNYFSAKNVSFTYSEVENQIKDIFNEMYTLKLRHVTEKRTRIEKRIKTETWTETRTGTRQHWYYDENKKSGPTMMRSMNMRKNAAVCIPFKAILV